MGAAIAHRLPRCVAVGVAVGVATGGGGEEFAVTFAVMNGV